jgi:hypothetical protein
VLFIGYNFIAGGLDSDEKKRVLVIGVLVIFASIFWSAFEQAPTSLNLFARDFTERTIFGWEVPATWFQSINSLFIFLLAPFFAFLWTKLGSKGKDLSSPAKFSLGLFFAGVGFLIMIPAANLVVGAGGGADATKVVAESDEGNNAHAGGQVAVGYGPDLVISAVSAPPTTSPWGNLDLTVTVCNQGTSGGNGEFQVVLSTDDTITTGDSNVADGYVGYLVAGQCATRALFVGASVPTGRRGRRN